MAGFLRSGPIRGLQMAEPIATQQQFGNYAGDDPGGGYLHRRAMEDSDAYARSIDPASDPLGIERMQAAQSSINTMSDVNGMARFMQAIKERAPGGIQTPSRRGDPLSGLPTSPLGQPSTMWQPGQTSAVTGQGFTAPYFSDAQYAANPRLGAMRKQANTAVAQPNFDASQAFKGLQGAR